MSPFDGLNDKEKDKIKEALNAHIYEFNKGDELITFINSKNMVGVVLEGKAKLILNSYTGEEILIEEFKKDSIFGNNISDINNADTKMYAMEHTKVAIVDYNFLISDTFIQKEWYNRLIKNLFRILVIRSNEINKRLRILTKKSIRDRLIEFFNIEYEKRHTKTFYLGIPLKDLADYLSVNRSAMFRELKFLKEDNIISIVNKKVTILYWGAKWKREYIYL